MITFKRKKRPKTLRRTRKKYSNLEEKVKEFILYLRDEGYSKHKFESGRTFYGSITKEDFSAHFGVNHGEIQKCFHKFNLEGLITQAKKKDIWSDEGWEPDFYIVYNVVRAESKKTELKLHYNYNRCPVCDEPLRIENRLYDIYFNPSYSSQCSKLCFQYSIFSDTSNSITIFGKTFTFDESFSKGRIDQTKNIINKEINYWKKDLRYIAEWLTRN